MLSYIAIILLAAALFLAMILNLAAKPAVNAKITTGMLIIAIAGGVIIYGYGFASVIPNFFLSTIRTLLAVCGMFVRKNEFSAIAAAPDLDNPAVVFFFWMIHLFALYTSASAAITTVGAEALKSLRLMLSRRGELTLIYGCSEDAINLGRECNAQKDMSVVYVSENVDAGAATLISRLGAAFMTGSFALEPNAKFIKSLGIRPGGRQVHVYCMKDESSNYNYAQKLKEAFHAAGIHPNQLSLTLLGQEDSLSASLQVYGEEYGYGNVFLFQKQDQAARLLMRKCPPWQNMHFDENGCATEDFEALVVGFGSYGQSVLKYLVQNGQFAGSHFHATVISHHIRDGAGYLEALCPNLFEKYDVNLIEADGRSAATFRFVEEHKDTLKYIVVCIGDGKTNDETAGQLKLFLSHLGRSIPVVQCSEEGIRWNGPRAQVVRNPLLSRETLDMEISDRMAMALNHKYNLGSGHTAWEDWENCDYFSRMSSRASADFIPAMLQMLHISEKDAAAMESLSLTPEQQENLGRTEHDRWCAFHFAMGFSPMTREMWDDRAAKHLADKEAGNPKPLRIGKDMPGRVHSCLIPWEELDELSARENAVTGGHLDYKQMDINNVLEIPVVLRLKGKGNGN